VCTAVVETQALTRNVQHHLINLIRKKTGNLTANGAPLIETDIIGINGVMHTIDGLLIPKNGKCPRSVFSVRVLSKYEFQRPTLRLIFVFFD